MTTALKIIERGASKAKVKAAGVALSAEEISDGLDILNGIIKNWSAIGILKGVSPTYDINTDLKEPEYATEALKSQVGMKMIVEFGYMGDLSVASASANEDMHNMLVAKPKENIVYPDTLPLGSGNYDLDGDDFFPQNLKDNF
jgi:hypothetical protein